MLCNIRILKLVLALLLVYSVVPALIYIPDVPVDPMKLYQLQVSCNMLQNRLNLDPTLPKSMAYYYYADTYLANYFLQQVANDPGIANYNNVIFGGNNTAAGNKNIIFGNGNQVFGSNNYVFSQGFNSSSVSNTAISNNLVLDNWLIKLYNMYLIPFNPKLSISQW